MITTWSEGNADDNMSEDILVEQARNIRRHPWWIARAKLTIALLGKLGIAAPARVLDAGCGWGITMEALEEECYEVHGLDISRRALDMLDRSRPGRTLIHADVSQAMPGDADRYDAILLLDVIEHLDDDRSALERVAGLLRPGGVLVVSVPALPQLYSDFDRVQGHRRRYLPDTLRRAFNNTGLDVERTFWWGAWMVPVVRWQRRRVRVVTGSVRESDSYSQYLKLPPWPLTTLLRAAFAVEERHAIAGRLTSGTSLFCVARRGV